MKCPKCESENTQRLEVAYQSGTQNISTASNSAGLGFSGGRIGIAGGVSKTSGQTQSALAVACSPPVMKPTKPLKWAIAGSGALILWGISMHWVVPLIGVALAVLNVRRLRSHSQFNSTEWPQLYQHWAESWICHKCGGIYHQV